MKITINIESKEIKKGIINFKKELLANKKYIGLALVAIYCIWSFCYIVPDLAEGWANYITFEGTCQKMDGKNLTINGVTFSCNRAFDNWDREAFLDSEIKFRACYNEDSNTWWIRSIAGLSRS